MEWYEEINVDGEITQGEIILNCPILLPNREYDFSKIYEAKNVPTVLYKQDVIVLTQACDLANDPIPENIMLCRIQDISGTSNTVLKEINSYRRPQHHLINKKENGTVKFNYQILDFADIYTVPIASVKEAIKRQEKRVILNSPYREFVSQRFGNYYSRIGLPNIIDISDALSSK